MIKWRKKSNRMWLLYSSITSPWNVSSKSKKNVHYLNLMMEGVMKILLKKDGT